MAASWLIWEARETRVGGGVIRYRDEGDGRALLFVHGVLANGTLWREVVARLSENFRCIVPDLPLGGHSVPMESGVDLTLPGVARMVVDLMEELDLREVTLVGNDTGGAICQIVISNHPERIGRLVLTNCDAYEAFFPLLLRPVELGARVFGVRFVDFLTWTVRPRPVQRLMLRTAARRRVDDEILDAYFAPLLSDPGVRRDLTRFLAQVSNRYTLEAASSFPNFRRPVLIVWGEDDLFFLKRYARRLARDFPDATLEFVPDCRAFVPEDRPERLAELIESFLLTRGSATP